MAKIRKDGNIIHGRQLVKSETRMDKICGPDRKSVKKTSKQEEKN